MIDDGIVKKLNEAVLEKFNEADNGSWQEDSITEIILITLKNNISEVSLFNKIEWNICKYRGKLENTFGDIAFVIKIYFMPDKYIEGVYFIEAKKFDLITEKYVSIEFDNLERYIEYSQAHSTLLYNINQDMFGEYQNILTLPTHHLIALHDKSKKIEDYTDSFEYLLNDLFKGKNLDYRKEKLDDAKGFVSNTGKKFKYIVTTAIALKQNIDMNLSMINTDHYQTIDSDKSEQNQVKSNRRTSFRR